MVYLGGPAPSGTLTQEEELDAITKILQIKDDVLSGKHPQFSLPSTAAPIPPPPLLQPPEPWKLGAVPPPNPKPSTKNDLDAEVLARRLMLERQRLESGLEKQLAKRKEEAELEVETNGLLLPPRNGKGSADGTSPIAGEINYMDEEQPQSSPPIPPLPLGDGQPPAVPVPKKKSPPPLPQRRLINYGVDSPVAPSTRVPVAPEQPPKETIHERRQATSRRASPRLSPRQQRPSPTWDRPQQNHEDQYGDRRGSRCETAENFPSRDARIPPPPPPPQYVQKERAPEAAHAFRATVEKRPSPRPAFARRSPPTRHGSPPRPPAARPVSPPEITPRVSHNQLQDPPVAPQPVRPALVLQHSNDRDVEMHDGPFRERDREAADVSVPRSARSPVMKQESMGNSPDALNRIPLRSSRSPLRDERPPSTREREASRFRYEQYREHAYPPPPPPRRPESLYDAPPYFDPYRRDPYRDYGYYPPPPPPPPAYGYPYRPDYDPYARAYLPAPPPLPPREEWRGRRSVSPRAAYPPPPASVRIRSSRSRSPDGRAATAMRSASIAPSRRLDYERSVGRASVAPPPVLDGYYARAVVPPPPPPLPYYPHDPYRRAPAYYSYPPPPPRAASRAMSAYPEPRGYDDRRRPSVGREREMYPPPPVGIPPPEREGPPPFRERDYDYPPPPRGYSPAGPPPPRRALETWPDTREFVRPAPPPFERDRERVEVDRERERGREYPPHASMHPHPPAPPPQEFMRERERERDPGFARYADEERMVRREEDYERVRMEARSVRAASRAASVAQGPPRDEREREYMRYERGYP